MKALILSALLFSGAAHADFMDGNTLHKYLNGSQMQKDLALGYIMGISDSGYRVLHCTPANATAGQVRDMTIITLNSEPENRSESAYYIVMGMLARYFPCSKGTL